MRGYIEKRQRNDGKYSYRVEVFVGTDPDTGKKVRHKKTFARKKDAEAYLQLALTDLATEGVIRNRSNGTLESYLRRWLDVAARPRLRPKTFEDYENNLKRYVLPRKKLARKALRTVTPADIQELYGQVQEEVQKRGRGTGATTVRYLHTILRSAFNQAVKWREVALNPVLFVDRPKIERKERAIVSHEDFPAFFRAAMEQDRNGLVWVCALATGARPEEYLAWQWRDVDWSACEIRILRALVRPRKRKKDEPAWRFEPVKTKAGRRVVAVPSEVMFLLRKLQAEQAEEKLLAGEAWEDNGLIFCNRLGGPLHQMNLARRDFKQIIKRAGLNRKLTPYSLRHSCASGLLAMGEDIGQVSSLLGHSSSSFTFDTYVKKRPLQSAASKMQDALFGGDQMARPACLEPE